MDNRIPLYEGRLRKRVRVGQEESVAEMRSRTYQRMAVAAAKGKSKRRRRKTAVLGEISTTTTTTKVEIQDVNNNNTEDNENEEQNDQDARDHEENQDVKENADLDTQGVSVIFCQENREESIDEMLWEKNKADNQDYVNEVDDEKGEVQEVIQVDHEEHEVVDDQEMKNKVDEEEVINEKGEVQEEIQVLDDEQNKVDGEHKEKEEVQTFEPLPDMFDQVTGAALPEKRYQYIGMHDWYEEELIWGVSELGLGLGPAGSNLDLEYISGVGWVKKI